MKYFTRNPFKFYGKFPVKIRKKSTDIEERILLFVCVFTLSLAGLAYLIVF